MRTLLIDNYDSFTYNIAHYLAEISGEEPVVITHDDPGWTPGRLAEFDNVVISPGPGRPQRSRDLGLSADVIRRAEIPVLGICLGHQALCHLDGGAVDNAPEVRHGRLSAVSHDGAGLFEGLPSPFKVVRYHSLAVSELPDSLEAVAWSDDGVLMGVRHRTRPAWGVQFHPESICTEHGHDLLRNFNRLTAEWQRTRSRATSAATAVGPRAAAETEKEPTQMEVLHRRLDVEVDAERVFTAFHGTSADAFWLDSSKVDGEFGRYSFMGDAAGPRSAVATADVANGVVTVRSRSGVQQLESGFFDWIERDLARRRVRVPELPFEFALGWVGYLGYELKAECGARAAHEAETPDAAMVFADRGIVFDHVEQQVHLLVLADRGGDERAARWLDETESALRALHADPGPAVPEPEPQPIRAPLSLRHGRDDYLKLIQDSKDAIDAGETYEVCLTNMVSTPERLDSWEAYRFLRRTSPAPFAAFLRFDDVAVLSTSPERFLSIDRNRIVESKPIKGTRPRSADPVEDERLRQELATNEKDQAENLMIVDLVRNDLGRTAEIGSVKVDKLFDVETYARVHQLVSTVRATLRTDRSPVACVRSSFPGGSMTGAPKIRTMEIIDEFEAGPRGVYSGAIGYFSLSGAADFSIVIRTLTTTPNGAHFGVGGAIIALSDPDAEYEETAVKSEAMLRLLATTFPDRAR
ncbi:aminodeoxychorismate synthase component I [Saccharopolyspora taberi]|uniref:aminodeoxychorismate synthase n=1 Tax=Saccharopolyspora taberi TaxID=60895 RepID=A0ABN3V6N8_9PSEU